MFMEVHLITLQLCEFNTVISVINLQNSNANLGFLLLGILALSYELEFDLVMVFIYLWIDVFPFF